MYYILCVHWRERETLSMRERERVREERGGGGRNVIWVQRNGAKTWTFSLSAVFLQSG